MIRLAVLLLSAGAVVYGLWLVAVGQGWTVVDELGNAQATREPTVAGVYPLIGGGLCLLGAVARRWSLAAAGAALMLVFSVLFAFGVGGVMIPVAVVLLVLSLAAYLIDRERVRAV